MNKPKILVVDNDKDICWLIVSILKEEGYNVDNAYNGESALEKINRHHYEILVLDYKLSELSGLSILETARQRSPLFETIMISAFGNESVRLKAKELGVYAFLDKPFDINRLKKTVELALIAQKKKCGRETRESYPKGIDLSIHLKEGSYPLKPRFSFSCFCSAGTK